MLGSIIYCVNLSVFFAIEVVEYWLSGELMDDFGGLYACYISGLIVVCCRWRTVCKPSFHGPMADDVGRLVGTTCNASSFKGKVDVCDKNCSYDSASLPTTSTKGATHDHTLLQSNMDDETKKTVATGETSTIILQFSLSRSPFLIGYPVDPCDKLTCCYGKYINLVGKSWNSTGHVDIVSLVKSKSHFLSWKNASYGPKYQL